MEDTSREIKALQQTYWMKLPEEERFRRCGELFSLAKRSAEERAPEGLTEKEKRHFVLRELYGADFAEMVANEES